MKTLLQDLKSAQEPPEARGLERDQVKLLVSTELKARSTLFSHLESVLRPGDLLVFNNSATIPAALLNGRLHFSTHLGQNLWLVEFRSPGGLAPAQPGDFLAVSSQTLYLPGEAKLTLRGRFRNSPRLHLALLESSEPSHQYLTRWGRPIRYRYVPKEWPLEAYQTIFAQVPGSVEMPSAGRAFTPELKARLKAKGIALRALTLHTGVSSLESGESPFPEYYSVPNSTLEAVLQTRRKGHRVVAVGTTVVRALESVAAHGLSGWTELMVGPHKPPELVNGLLSGFHDSEASHLLLLEAFVGAQRLHRDYLQAYTEGYLKHEFGDLHLLLP